VPHDAPYVPPPNPLHSIVEKVAAPNPQDQYRQAEEKRLAEERARRQREMEAEQRRRIEQTQQMR
jgi:hypothetical protein